MTVSMKNTKKELLDAYEATNKLLLETKKSKSTGTPLPKDIVVKVEQNTSTVQKTSSIEGILENFLTLKSEFSLSSNLLQEKLSQEAIALQEVDEEVESCRENLKTLYDIAFDDESLENLMEAYIEREEKQEALFVSKKEEGEEAFKLAQESWCKERQFFIEKREEATDERLKKEEREVKEYTYTQKQREAKDKDSFLEQGKVYANEFKSVEENQVELWKEKEEVLAKKELEAKTLKEKAEALEENLNKEIKKASEEGTGIAKRQSKNEAMLLEKDYEGEERVLKLKIASVQSLISKQEIQITQLSDKLSTAIKQAQDLALKALEGNANSNSFEAMKEIALEQAKNSSKGK
ncbi:Myosin heavy chain [hydrothermal vent metagenome]|uniref:Myosin heavy chain n=1 Tax=hydrothermal vent metagenome TaxID=652676 RepID=A0A1W1D0D3_9ZZZZ